MEFSLANAADFFDEEHDEEPGEEIESAPPLNIGEERELSSSGIKKKLIKHGISWETPEVGDEVTGITLKIIHDKNQNLIFVGIFYLFCHPFHPCSAF